MYYIHTQVVLHIYIVLPHTVSPARNIKPKVKGIFIWIYSCLECVTFLIPCSLYAFMVRGSKKKNLVINIHLPSLLEWSPNWETVPICILP
jgi:hypothetical protein